MATRWTYRTPAATLMRRTGSELRTPFPSGGGPHHEPGFQQTVRGLDVSSASLRSDSNSISRLRAGEALIVLRHGCQRRTGEARKRMVVVAGDAQIAARLDSDPDTV